MEYKVFIMEILNDLYLIREDVKDGPGKDAIAALIKKIESRPMGASEEKRSNPSGSNSIRPGAEINVSKCDQHDGVYIYQFKK